MHKVISINLNGNAYQVDEAGYDALCDYLDGAAAQLKDNPDLTEIMADLEQAIAEKCSNFLNPHKTIVTAAEIAQIILEMGPVDGASESGEENSARAPGTDTRTKTKAGSAAPKRLYRIREGKMASGVCQGMAAYFGVDVAILRIVFIALAVLTHGAWVLAYIVLTFVIPYAQTSEEHAAAFGMPFNAKDFIDQAKEHYSDFAQEGTKWKRKAKESKREWQQAWRRTMRNPERWWTPTATTATSEHHFSRVMMPIFSVAIALLSLIFIFAFISFVSHFAPFRWAGFGHPPLWAGLLILFVFLNAVVAPFRFARRRSYPVYTHPFSGLIAVWGSILWTVFVIFVVWIAYNRLPEVHYFIDNLRGVWDDFINSFRN